MVVGITALRLRVLIRIGQLTSDEEKWAHTSSVFGHFAQKWTFVDRAMVELQKGGLVKRDSEEAVVALSKKGWEIYEALCKAMAQDQPKTRSARQILRGE